MADKKQVTATISNEVVTDVSILAKKETRSFSFIVDMLLKEALAARTVKPAKK